MAKKNPYSILDTGRLSKALGSDWAEGTRVLLEGKTVHPVQFRFFVDGFNFYLRCQKEAERKAEYVLWLFENWSERPVPDIVINADVLASIGRGFLSSAEDLIADKFIDMSEALDQSFVLASNIFTAARRLNSPLGETEIDRIKSASAILDPYYVVDIYAAKPPTTDELKRMILKKLRNQRGKNRESGRRLLEENLELVRHRKVRSRFGVNNIGEYEQFINSFNNRELDQTNFAVNRYDAGDDGGIWLKEKGVDAMLIMGMLDAKGDPDTDAICLFSNDSDFYPVLDRSKEESTRPLFLAVPNDGSPI